MPFALGCFAGLETSSEIRESGDKRERREGGWRSERVHRERSFEREWRVEIKERENESGDGYESGDKREREKIRESSWREFI